MKNLLNQLSQKLDDEAKRIIAAITDADKYESALFNSVLVFDTIEQRPYETKGRKGIYIFMIREPVELDFKKVSAWNSVPGAGFKLYNQESLKHGDCLYVGSCVSLSIFARMTQHFKENSASSGLKLEHKSRSIALNAVRVYAFTLDKDLEEYCSILLPQLEKRLHNILKPKAGSSRV